LRSVLDNTSKNSVGNEARAMIHLLQTHTQAASLTVDCLRQDQHNPQAKFIVQQYEQAERRARDLVEHLTTNASYSGPRRANMTTGEKVQHIAKHGSEEFLRLPN
jgi:hypothetical protein